jgi:hypothetical protein
MILQGLTSSFKLESWQGIHDLDTDTLKFALYTGNATLDSTTTVYTTSNEVVGAGYTAGGVLLTGVVLTLSGTTAYLTFDNPTWSGTSFICRGALVYNFSKADRSIAVIDFGDDKTASGSFVVNMPVATATTALIRFA